MLTVSTDVAGEDTAATRRKYVSVAVVPAGIVTICCAFATSPFAPDGAESNRTQPLPVLANAPHPAVLQSELPNVVEVDVQFGFVFTFEFASKLLS